MSTDPNNYQVGWICALTSELVMARSMLDEEYKKPKMPHIPSRRDEPHKYFFGRIGEHNIVIACLPMGRRWNDTVSAVAKAMKSHFRQLNFGLLVGIAGGAPSARHDVRLGDVVVSVPTLQYGGVVAYNHGKTVQDQKFQIARHLTAPPEMLLTALTGLESDHIMAGNQIVETIDQMLNKHKKLRKRYSRPNPAWDKLYHSSYIHTDSSDSPCHCQVIDDGEGGVLGQPAVIKRPGRDENGIHPEIHYGLIASADRVMKDAVTRDRIVADYDVLCFDMESVGVMDIFNCLVIRGISNYADTHKSDIWQRYAAATAAAFAKELLLSIDGNIVTRAPIAVAKDVIGRAETSLGTDHRHVDSIVPTMQAEQRLPLPIRATSEAVLNVNDDSPLTSPNTNPTISASDPKTSPGQLSAQISTSNMAQEANSKDTDKVPEKNITPSQPTTDVFGTSHAPSSLQSKASANTIQELKNRQSSRIRPIHLHGRKLTSCLRRAGLGLVNAGHKLETSKHSGFKNTVA